MRRGGLSHDATCARRSAGPGLGSAAARAPHFWRQRLTAIANVPLILFFVGFLIALNGAGLPSAGRARDPLVAVVMILVLISASINAARHAVIIEDYVHGEGGKLALLILNTFFAIAVGALAIFALLKLAFGG